MKTQSCNDSYCSWNWNLIGIVMVLIIWSEICFLFCFLFFFCDWDVGPIYYTDELKLIVSSTFSWAFKFFRLSCMKMLSSKLHVYFITLVQHMLPILLSILPTQCHKIFVEQISLIFRLLYVLIKFDGSVSVILTIIMSLQDLYLIIVNCCVWQACTSNVIICFWKCNLHFW